MATKILIEATHHWASLKKSKLEYLKNVFIYYLDQ